MLQAAIVLYMFIELPIRIAFLATDKLRDGVHAWDSMVDVFLLLDFLVHFVTAFHSHDYFGQMRLNVNIRAIAVNYIHTGFMLDMAACLPWDKLARGLGSSALTASYLRLLKITRILHISFLAKMLNEIVDRYAPTAVADACTLGFFMFFFNHVVSCFLYWASHVAEATTDCSIAENPECGWTAHMGWDDATSLKTRYTTAFYYSLSIMTTVGFGDISGKINRDKLAAVLVMVLGCAMFGYIMGRIGIIVHSRHMAHASYEAKLREVDAYMTFRESSPGLRRCENF